MQRCSHLDHPQCCGLSFHDLSFHPCFEANVSALCAKAKLLQGLRLEFDCYEVITVRTWW